MSAALEDGAENLQQRLLMSSPEFPDGCSNLAATHSGVNVTDSTTGSAWNIEGSSWTEDEACITVGSAPQQRKSPVETERPLGGGPPETQSTTALSKITGMAPSDTYALHHVSCTKK
ncbi:hypothetical protein MRX96_034489 [Rhipicephalus microplus]